MQIIFSDEFKHELRKIKDSEIRLRIIKQIKKIESMPEAGKPLRHNLKGHRSLRIPPYRLIYRIEGGKVIINCFDHRKEVYE
ncbi:MAG: type II toxin-antitoxin system RelE/ParE family toxin [Nanoarchaeota archaeon]|nr:type II toxin-antitoxin system RelE/ParE family toxin [Nanoarchaeota archaeon]